MIRSHVFLTALLGCALVAGCTQSTPSMMNTSKPELVSETHIEQIPSENVDDIAIAILADQYSRFGNGPLELTMTYDPKSKNYTAMKARHSLSSVKAKLAKKGITNVKLDTLAVEGETPSLMVMYPSVVAQGPSDCGVMPGLEDYQTTRHIGMYQFGCATETLLAKQVARPSDLQGRGGNVMGVNEGRRITNVMETYHTLNEDQAAGALTETLERDGLQAE